MWSIAIETSTPRGSLALFHESSLVELRVFQAHRGHNSKIFQPLEDLLSLLPNRKHLTQVVVGTGPGSYTGVRISIAIAQALALSNEATLIGLSSFLAPHGESSSHYHIVGDARRGKWYRAMVYDGALSESIILEDRELWESHIADALKQGVPVRAFEDQAPMLGVEIDYPCASALGRQALSKPLSANESRYTSVEPIYLSAPFITKAKKPGKAIPKA